MKKSKLENNKIPLPQRDNRLIVRLIPIVLCGFDNVLDKKGRLYLRLLCRLVSTLNIYIKLP